MTDRPEWLKKKIRKAQRDKAKRDPERARKEADIRRQNWLIAQEFRAITKDFGISSVPHRAGTSET